MKKVMWLSMPAHGQGHYQVLMAMAITIVPDYDGKGQPLVWASLVVVMCACVVIAAYRIKDLKKCWLKKPESSPQSALSRCF